VASSGKEIVFLPTQSLTRLAWQCALCQEVIAWCRSSPPPGLAALVALALALAVPMPAPPWLDKSVKSAHLFPATPGLEREV